MQWSCNKEKLVHNTLKPIERQIWSVKIFGWKQKLHVERKKCTGEQQRQTEEKRLTSQDAQHGFVEPRREHIRLHEE